MPPILRRSLPRRSYLLQFLLLAAAGLLACACASTPEPEAAGEPQRIRLVTYTNPLEFELVNTTHTGRVEQYSTKRERANRKVQSDEVMSALIEWMDDNGFQRLSRPGHAPSAAVQGVTWALEVDRAKGAAHVLLTTSMAPEDVKDCIQLKNGFLELFNSTYGLQAVESKPGEVPFKTPDRKARR